MYTVSLSEAGVERIWQGAEVTVSWLVALGAEPWTARIGVELERHEGAR